MPPKVALLICMVFILYLLRIEYKMRLNVSYGLWISLLWMLILASRPVSQWLNLGFPVEAPFDYLEGSPVDRSAFIALIAVGLVILIKRKLRWMTIVRSNALLSLYILYCGLSVLWSDFPVVSLKRWVKEVGTIVMVLVVLSDVSPEESFGAILRRCTYILVPLSVLFIKYYPDLGRGYSSWSWEVIYAGVTTNKNSLGVLCLVCGTVLVWSLLKTGNRTPVANHKDSLSVHVILLVMIIYLLAKASSVTSLSCSIIGVFLMVGARMGILGRDPRLIMRRALIIGLCLVTFVLLFRLEAVVFSALGRDETLTGRTAIWDKVLDEKVNPFVGTGYEAFWLGNRVKAFWEKYSFPLNQSHNGYLEVYLNLGVIGLFLLAGVVVSAYRTIRKSFDFDAEFGLIRLVFFIIVLVHNITEASFKGMSLLWFVFLLIGTEVPIQAQAQRPGARMVAEHGAQKNERSVG